MAESAVLEIPQGVLRGEKVTSPANGVSYYSFQGIPYAKPPLGPLRFKPPEDPVPWRGVREALKEGPAAVQINVHTNKFFGEEDCLFLNVYTPQFNATLLKPVMVWIHGGKFSMGSGNVDHFGPDFLVAKDIVLVTLNYRLGALGFLYLEGADITGNNGFRDQVMALKWVKNNIEHFGGDPDNVTIFGESAGGGSVHFLMLSPLATGLFHRAIAQSGTAFIGGANVTRDACSRRARRLAELLGCPSEDPQQAADFLRTVPAEVFAADKRKALAGDELQQALLDRFFPSYEAGSDPFLPDSPRKLLESGRFTKVPFMIGVTSAEGKVMLFDPDSRTRLSDIDKDFVSVLPMELTDNLDAETCHEIASLVKKYYFGGKQLSKDTVSQYIDMQSDLEFVFPAHETAKQQAKWSPEPTYVYVFDHMSAPGFAFMRTTADEVPGVPHAGELPYLFKGTTFRNFPPGSPDAEVRDKVINLWTQFARTGNPSNDEVTWTPATQEKLNYLKINGGLRMETDMFKRRMKFWEDLYNKYLPKSD